MSFSHYKSLKYDALFISPTKFVQFAFVVLEQGKTKNTGEAVGELHASEKGFSIYKKKSSVVSILYHVVLTCFTF